MQIDKIQSYFTAKTRDSNLSRLVKTRITPMTEQ